MFASRADVLSNFAYLATLIAPVVSLLSYRLARRGEFHRHRRLQVGLLVFCWAAVLGLELDIRLSGGSGSVIARALPAYQVVARRLLLVHITAAIATYGLWTVLAVASLRRFGRRLPGAFSSRHRRLGWLVFSGLLFTALSATGMYVLTFVL